MSIEIAEEFKSALIHSFLKTTDRRKDNKIHVSNLIDFCPREFALCQQLGVDYNSGLEKMSFAEALTFAIGDAFHRTVQQKMKESQYVKHTEVVLTNNAFGIEIIGNCDLFFHASNGKIIATELKSYGKEEFDTLQRPEITHECQLSWYLWLINQNPKLRNVIETKFGLVAYLCKLRRSMPLKVFPIQRNDEFLKSRIAQLKEVKTFSETQEMPARMCNSIHALMAKRCSLPKQCFEYILKRRKQHDGDSKKKSTEQTKRKGA